MDKSTNLISLKALAYFMAAVYAFTIPLPIKFHNVAIVITLILFFACIQWKEISKTNFKYKILPVLVLTQFCIVVAGLLYSSNIDAGFNDLERAFYPLAIIPIVYLMQSKGVSVYRLLQFFTISCIALAIYGLVYAGSIGDTKIIIDILHFEHSDFINYTSIQPLYLSVYLILVLFFLLESIRTKYDILNTTKKWALAGASLLVIVIVIFLRSKTALLLLPTLLVIYLVIILKKRGWLLVFVLMVVGVLTFLLDKGNSPNLIDDYGAVSNAFDQRLYIWKGAIEGIKSSPWIGAGTGGTQELLNSGYQSIDYQEGVVNEFNAHNQYLQFVARNGLLELIVFLSLLGYSFWRSAKKSNYTFLMFNVLVSFVMITESFLSVQKGIVFFYFFLFAFTYLDVEVSGESKIQ